MKKLILLFDISLSTSQPFLSFAGGLSEEARQELSEEGFMRRPEAVPPDVLRGTLRCLDNSGASLFLLEPKTEDPLIPPDAGTFRDL